MDYATELYGMLSLYFSGNKARVVCMTNILIGLMKSATTNLHKVSGNMPGSVKTKSKYRRIQRFFEHVTLDWEKLASYIVKQISFNSKFILILDRTNWKLGKTNINLLVLSVAWHGVSIPIFWVNLAKAGNSNTKDRMLIFSKAIRLLRISNIEALLGDREFIGEDWLHWLDYYGIIFVVRIKDNSLLHKNKKYRKATNSFRTLSRKCMRCLACNLWDLELTVVGYKDKDGNVQILATNGNPKSAVKLYAIRWQIESMFLCLKSNGFNLEETHMVCQEKVELLFGLLAILTCWNCKIGLWCNQIKPIKIKNHGRPEQNLFHYGMTIISSVISNIVDYGKDFKKIIKILKKSNLSEDDCYDMGLVCL